jgi:predicted MPP superfamily phosphohydrolase
VSRSAKTAFAQKGRRVLPAERAPLIVHSSDLHLDSGTSDGELDSLERVIEVSQRLDADLLLLAGDVFDNNRVPLTLIDRASRLLADVDRPVVILPGNHDCLVPESVYRRGGLADPSNIWVLGVSVDDSVLFSALDLEVWGRAHFDYGDMSPLSAVRPKSARWQIAVAHGHLVRGPHDLHRSYLIRDDEIADSGADYVALGHWDVAFAAGDGKVPAYYSGSPDYAGTVNVVRFGADGLVEVRREPAARLR